MKPVRTWVLVADGSRARIVENLGPGKGLREVEGMAFHSDLPPNREILSDRPGRSFESSSATRHALDGSDPRRLMKHAFARQLAETLDDAIGESRCDRCVLVAPPEMMGELRREISQRVRERLRGELVLDLTKVADDRLAEHLGEVLPV
jgi:protein required for attachment to host cells